MSAVVLRALDPFPLHAPPAWPDAAPVTREALERVFDDVEPYTVGLEDELVLCNADTLDLAPIVGQLVSDHTGDVRLKQELPASQLEIVTPVCTGVPEAVSLVVAARREIAFSLAGRARPLAAGTHPFAEVPIALSAGERYDVIADEYRWAAPRGLASGLHVHVAVPGLERALHVVDGLRSYLPLVTALAANAPIFGGVDTGLATVRPKLCEGFPRQGVPPAFGTVERYLELLEWGRRGGAYPDASHFWWEARLHPRYGTVEVRGADTPTHPDHLSALASVLHALVVWLAERAAGGEQLAVHSTVRIQENRWRALRHGLDGSLLDLDTGEAHPTRLALRALLDDLAPTAETLGCSEGLDHARALLVGNGADRQRAVFERDGVLGLTAWLCSETIAGSL